MLLLVCAQLNALELYQLAQALLAKFAKIVLDFFFQLDPFVQFSGAIKGGQTFFDHLCNMTTLTLPVQWHPSPHHKARNIGNSKEAATIIIDTIQLFALDKSCEEGNHDSQRYNEKEFAVSAHFTVKRDGMYTRTCSPAHTHACVHAPAALATRTHGYSLTMYHDLYISSPTAHRYFTAAHPFGSVWVSHGCVF